MMKGKESGEEKLVDVSISIEASVCCVGMDGVEEERGSADASAKAAAFAAARFCFCRSLFIWRGVQVAAVAEPEETPGSAVPAARRAMGVVFFRQRGQRGEEERCLTVLQVRHVLG